MSTPYVPGSAAPKPKPGPATNPPKHPETPAERRRMLKASVARLAKFRNERPSVLMATYDAVSWVQQHIPNVRGRPGHRSDYGPAMRLARKIMRLRQKENP